MRRKRQSFDRDCRPEQAAGPLQQIVRHRGDAVMTRRRVETYLTATARANARRTARRSRLRSAASGSSRSTASRLAAAARAQLPRGRRPSRSGPARRLRDRCDRAARQRTREGRAHETSPNRSRARRRAQGERNRRVGLPAQAAGIHAFGDEEDATRLASVDRFQPGLGVVLIHGRRRSFLLGERSRHVGAVGARPVVGERRAGREPSTGV
jgi:hypothetical protein